MMKGIIAAIGLAMALPAFADNDTAKDVKDYSKDAVDSGKDALHTDSGFAKAKRHAKRQGRDAKRDARHKSHDIKRDARHEKNKVRHDLDLK